MKLLPGSWFFTSRILIDPRCRVDGRFSGEVVFETSKGLFDRMIPEEPVMMAIYRRAIFRYHGRVMVSTREKAQS